MSSNKAQGSCAQYKVPWSACSRMTGAEGLHSSCACCQNSRHVMSAGEIALLYHVQEPLTAAHIQQTSVR